MFNKLGDPLVSNSVIPQGLSSGKIVSRDPDTLASVLGIHLAMNWLRPKKNPLDIKFNFTGMYVKSEIII